MNKILSILMLAFLMSCQDNQSVQEYLVEKQNDASFKTMSITPDILIASYDGLTADEISILKKIKSVNVAYLDANENQKLSQESETFEHIIKHENYKSLLRMNDGSQKMNLLYLGDPEDIDELLFYGKSDKVGMLLARLNSKSLEPNDMVEIVKMAENLNLNQFEGFMNSIKPKTEVSEI